MEPVDVDTAIVGGGIVGLAAAYRLLEARPDLRVEVVEAERDVATHQSARNSGVVHAGIYYPPGSAKARWCTAGRRDLIAFCDRHGVPLERNGKVVVAVDRDELPGLKRLAERARANGVRVAELTEAQVRELEPHVTAVAGLHVPSTAVTDFAAVARTLGDLVRGAGGTVRLATRVTALRERGDTVRISTTGGDLTARLAIVCAGLQADRLAALSGIPIEERIVPFRGAWLRLRPALSHLVKGNIYPVPGQQTLPFLGVHLTRRIDGEVWIGPNAVLAGSRSARRPWAIDAQDLWDAIRFPGLWRLAARHLGTGIGEVWRDLSIRAALKAVRRYVPDIGAGDVTRGPWGVRAQLVGRDGSLVDDFTLRTTDRVLHVLNAPSPAATASLSIGTELRDLALDRL